MRSSKSLHRVRSAAGRAGGLARWANVEREPTVQVRVYQSDADRLKRQPGTVAQAVRRLMEDDRRARPANRLVVKSILHQHLNKRAKLVPLLERPKFRLLDRCEGEILLEAAIRNRQSTIIRYRQEGAESWHWRGFEASGGCVWWYDIETDARGCVLADGALSKFAHGPAYDYMVEGLAPLPVDSPDWLIKPVGDEVADLAKCRHMLMPCG